MNYESQTYFIMNKLFPKKKQTGERNPFPEYLLFL